IWHGGWRKLKVMVTGAQGLVGRAVKSHCEEIADTVVAYDRRALDITDAAQVMATIEEVRPDAIINCAAWTDVDGCELDHDRAMAVNANGPESLARGARVVDALLITISTDYVFDGRKKNGFYTQQDLPNPESFYGHSKLEGERRAQKEHVRTVVVRTGFVFGAGGRNFLSTIVERGRRGEKLKAIKDAYGTPTYAHDLALRLRELAGLDLPETFHVVNSGDGVSFEEFARAALEAANLPVLVEPVEMKSLHRPAPRPENSRLKCLVSGPAGLRPLPFWKDALEHFVASTSSTEAMARN
ncbi:MAG TPA: dTDP-4-dehydrorhamnose reductase, partial [Pyrinomonadaceae bacterium]|nr:dTDP-4-dehydrorhamnose reductase [Pyrinomonadaceae bacterium]